MISGRSILLQKEAHVLCFIDYAKIYDKLRHKELFNLPRKVDLFRNDIMIMQNLYWHLKCLDTDEK